MTPFLSPARMVLPSGQTAQQTSAAPALKVASLCPLLSSHTFSVWSQDAETASGPSPLTATPQTPPEGCVATFRVAGAKVAQPTITSPKSCSGKLPARGSQFRSYDEQTSKPQGIPPHRQRPLSRFGNVHHPCTRASPQCHELPLQPTHAVVLKFLHELYVLLAAGTDSRVHLLRILAQYRAHGGADRLRRVNLK